jgi:hypothetical protein
MDKEKLINDALAQFVEELNAGREPIVEDYIQAYPEHGEELKPLLETALALHVQAANIKRQEAWQRFYDSYLKAEIDFLRSIQSRSLSECLPEWRKQSGILREEVVQGLMEILHLHPSQQDMFARYYHRLETGQLDPRKITPELAEAIGLFFQIPLPILKRMIIAPTSRQDYEGIAGLKVAARVNEQAVPRERPSSKTEPETPGEEEVKGLFTGGGFYETD